jgi:hypothetical protein
MAFQGRPKRAKQGSSTALESHRTVVRGIETTARFKILLRLSNQILFTNQWRDAMTFAAEKEMQHLGETRGCEDHDHDMVHELSRRLDAIWRYDQYIANADQRDKIKKFWVEMKSQEQENIAQLKQLLKDEISTRCF